MSGAFEIAAGAFAVVGVADVLVRAGRDLYNFLHDIEDAPQVAQRLCNNIAEIISLASTSGNLLRRLQNQTQSGPVAEVANNLSLALRALDREVKSLKTLTVKCKGSTKRWSNIRYALSEQRISKALATLEQSKSLLTSALTLADRELAVIENEHLGSLVQTSLEKIDSNIGMTQAVNAKIEASEQSLAGRLDTLHQDGIKNERDRQRALDAKLDGHHQESLTAIQCSQARVATTQDGLLRVAAQTSRRTARISRVLDTHSRLSGLQHQKTRELFVSTFQDSQIVRSNSLRRPNSGRQIVYAGEERDLIMPALFSLKKAFAMILDELVLKSCPTVSSEHISWLYSELQNLVASAAQEEASFHTGSTASLFDEWVYKGNAAIRTAAINNQPTQDPVTHSHRQGVSSALLRKRQPRNKHLMFSTSTGLLYVRLPCRRVTRDGACMFKDASLSFIPTIGGPFAMLNLSFTQILDRNMAPSIYAQLQIFVPCDEEEENLYYKLLRQGSIQEIDQALRDGVCSPYRVHSFTGVSWLFLCTVGYGRADVLTYLDSQGIGFSTLRQDSSVILGLILASKLDHVSKTLNAVLSICPDPSVLLADTVMYILTGPGAVFFNTTLNVRTFVAACLQRLLGMNFHTNLLDPEFNPTYLPWRQDLVPNVVRFLLEVGANPNAILTIGNLGLSLIALLLVPEELWKGEANPYFSAPLRDSVRKDFISALFESGANVSDSKFRGVSDAELAWGYGRWDMWCEALRENGMDVVEVDETKPQGWIWDDIEADGQWSESDVDED